MNGPDDRCCVGFLVPQGTKRRVRPFFSASMNPISDCMQVQSLSLPSLMATYQAVEQRDLLRCASPFVIAAYCMYGAFHRIRPPSI